MCGAFWREVCDRTVRTRDRRVAGAVDHRRGRQEAKERLMRDRTAESLCARSHWPSKSRPCTALVAGIGAALALAVVARSAAGPALSFAPGKTYTTGATPISVALGDLNR